MNEKIDPSKTVYFYDDRSKCDYFYKLKEILYQDEDSCLCIAEPTELDSQYPIKNEKIYFNLHSKEVESTDFSFWLATNDFQWIEKEIIRIKARSKE